MAEVTKMGVKEPRVPIKGRAMSWWRPARRPFEKLCSLARNQGRGWWRWGVYRPKSGIFTDMEENNPIMALSPVKAEYAVFIYGDVISALPVTSGPPPWVTMTAQRKRAKKVGGTITLLTRKRIRSFSIGMRKMADWTIQ